MSKAVIWKKSIENSQEQSLWTRRKKICKQSILLEPDDLPIFFVSSVLLINRLENCYTLVVSNLNKKFKETFWLNFLLLNTISLRHRCRTKAIWVTSKQKLQVHRIWRKFFNCFQLSSSYFSFTSSSVWFCKSPPHWVEMIKNLWNLILGCFDIIFQLTKSFSRFICFSFEIWISLSNFFFSYQLNHGLLTAQPPTRLHHHGEPRPEHKICLILPSSRSFEEKRNLMQIYTP